MSATLDSFERQQLSTGSLISKFATNLKNIGKVNITEAVMEARLNLLEMYWSQFSSRHFNMCVGDFNDCKYAKEDTFSTNEEYLNTKTELLTFRKTCSSKSLAETNNVTSSASAQLPKLSLPKFSGNILEWESFRAQFKSLVHDVPTFNDVARFQSLKSHMVGEAAQVIGNLSITEANYAGA